MELRDIESSLNVSEDFKIHLYYVLIVKKYQNIFLNFEYD